MVSVIVPVYNGAKTIRGTLDSLFAQTYQNMEIIVVNDGSTDTTQEVLASCGDRIKLISKPNGGVSSARNRGISEASGEFLMFVDADDLCEPQMVERAVSAQKEQNVQYVIFAVNSMENNRKNIGHLHPCKFSTHQQIEDHVAEIMNNGLNSPVSKLYSKRIIEANHLRFDEQLTLGEDMNFNLEYLLSVDSVAVVDEAFYCYLKDNSTATTSYHPNYMEKRVLSLNKMETTLQKHGLTNPAGEQSRVKLVYAGIFNLQNSGCPLSFKEKMNKVKKWKEEYRYSGKENLNRLFQILSLGIRYLPSWALYAAGYAVRVCRRYLPGNIRGISV